jgi:Flp pilus assembly pilin Flp
MIKFFKNFRKNDSGAVTVDWVVLTAAVAALAGAAYSAIQTGSTSLTEGTSTFLTDQIPTDGAGDAGATPDA